MSLEWLGKNVEKLTKAKVIINLHKASLMVVADAKRVCPVSPHGGRLRSSIAYTVDGSELTARVGTNVDYAPYVELGTVKMSAQPYLRPALDKNKAAINRLFRS